MDYDELLRIAEDAAAAAPEVGILAMFYEVRRTNIASGLNSAQPNIVSWSLLPAPVQAQVTAISQQTGKDVQSVIATATSLGTTLGQDVSTAVGSLASLLGL